MHLPALLVLLAPEVRMRGLRGLHPIFFSHHPLLLVIAIVIVVGVVLATRSSRR